MDISDYNTRLAQARQQYFDNTQEIKENYENQLEHEREVHKGREKKQAETYAKQKADFQQDLQDLLV